MVEHIKMAGQGLLLTALWPVLCGYAQLPHELGRALPWALF